MTDRHEKVADVDLLVLQNSGLRLQLAQKELENANVNSQLAEATHKNSILQLYLKYSLKGDDKFDASTGKIMYADEPLVDGSNKDNS